MHTGAHGIAWIGLGAMGLPMALRVADAGHNFIAFDTSDAARKRASGHGLNVSASLPQERIIVTVLPDGKAVRSVLGALPLDVLAIARPSVRRSRATLARRPLLPAELSSTRRSRAAPGRPGPPR